MKNFVTEVYKKSEQVDFVFFDFFDTLVHRNVHPDTIKQMWAMKLANEIHGMVASELYEIRIECEKYLAEKVGEFTYKQLLDEITRRLINSRAEKIDVELVARKMESVEISIEKEHLYKDETVFEVVHKFKDCGKRLFIISDFYMGKEILKEFLLYTGYENVFEEIFVSCDYGCSKADRRLYDVVIDKIGVKAEECLMIGDNRRNDYYKSRAKGLNACFREYKEYPERISKKTILQALKDVAEKKTDSFYDFFAFSLFYFIYKLYEQVKEDEIKDIFFMAREGYYLKKLFDFYLKKIGDNKIKTHYLYVSRRATYLPSLKILECEDFDAILNNEVGNHSYESFLKNLNFTNEDREEIREKLGIDKTEFSKEYKQFKKTEEYNNLRNCDSFKSIYEKRRINARDLLIKYLEQFKVDYNKDGLFVVDIGWKGSIQDNIYNLFEGKVRITGNYLGLHELTQVSCNNIKRGLLYSFIPKQTQYSRQWSFNRLVYENILHAPHPSTKEYRNKNGVIEPVYDKAEDEILFKCAQKIQDKIYVLFGEIFDIFSRCVYNPEDFEKVFVSIMVESIGCCKAADIILYKKMDNAHYNNFISLKSVSSIRGSYDRKIIIGKYLKYLKKITIVFSGELFLKFAEWIYSHKLWGIYPLYKWIVLRKEKKILSDLL